MRPGELSRREVKREVKTSLGAISSTGCPQRVAVVSYHGRKSRKSAKAICFAALQHFCSFRVD